MGISPFVLDECQLSPELFPAIKEQVRKSPKPGRFLLTGSVRFSSRKAIRESLTGRIVTFELLPMDLSESESRPLPNDLIRMLTAKSADLPLPGSRGATALDAKIRRYLEHGGLPGVFSVRDAAVRAQRFETQLETLLERDLRLVFPTTLGFDAIRRFAVFLADHQGEPFESIYLVRRVQSEGGQKRFVVYLEDQGEATHLKAGSYSEWHYRPKAPDPDSPRRQTALGILALHALTIPSFLPQLTS